MYTIKIFTEMVEMLISNANDSQIRSFIINSFDDVMGDDERSALLERVDEINKLAYREGIPPRVSEMCISLEVADIVDEYLETNPHYIYNLATATINCERET